MVPKEKEDYYGAVFKKKPISNQKSSSNLEVDFVTNSKEVRGETRGTNPKEQTFGYNPKGGSNETLE